MDRGAKPTTLFQFLHSPVRTTSLLLTVFAPEGLPLGPNSRVSLENTRSVGFSCNRDKLSGAHKCGAILRNRRRQINLQDTSTPQLQSEPIAVNALDCSPELRARRSRGLHWDRYRSSLFFVFSFQPVWRQGWRRRNLQSEHLQLLIASHIYPAIHDRGNDVGIASRVRPETCRLWRLPQQRDRTARRHAIERQQCDVIVTSFR